VADRAVLSAITTVTNYPGRSGAVTAVLGDAEREVEGRTWRTPDPAGSAPVSAIADGPRHPTMALVKEDRMPTKLDIKYTGVATAEDGRNGRVYSDDGKLDLIVTPPPGVLYKIQPLKSDRDGTPPVEGTNPEQLFAAAYSACFHGALGAVANAGELDITDSQVTAKVSVGKDAEGGMGLQVELCVLIPTLDKEMAMKVAEVAHTLCPFSLATRGNIHVDLTVL
jgi:lipoyl-dependent peroxiredoxin